MYTFLFEILYSISKIRIPFLQSTQNLGLAWFRTARLLSSRLSTTVVVPFPFIFPFFWESQIKLWFKTFAILTWRVMAANT